MSLAPNHALHDYYDVFTGKLFGDADVLALAMAWQRATDYDERHPKL